MQNTAQSEHITFRPNRFYRAIYSNRKRIVEVISALLILLFVYSALSKIIVIPALKFVLPRYPLVGKFPVLFAWGLPVAELVIAAILFIPRTRLAGLYSSFILMICFTLYLGYMFLFTPVLPCTCGGLLSKMTWPQHFVFNLCIAALSLTAAILERNRRHQLRN